MSSNHKRDWPSGSLGGELIRRRVPHMLGIFLGAAWVSLEFTDWLVQRYQLSSSIVDMVLIGMLAMAPSVLLVAWGHGAPGRDRWSNLERFGVPLNGIAALLLATNLSGGTADAASSVKSVAAVDEEGQPVVRQVVKESFIRGVSVFFVDNQGGDPALDWLQYGFAVALDVDLQQNPYLNVWSPFAEWEQYGFFLMRKAGYPDGIGLPTALQRQIAQMGAKEHFVSGSFDRQHDQIRLTINLYETASGAKVDSFTATGDEPLPLVDEVASAVVDALAIPSADELLTNIVNVVDLPVTDRLTASQDAFKHFVDALVALSLENDSAEALESYRRAIASDPSFALANLELSKTLWNVGQANNATAAVQRALQHKYRLLETHQFLARSLSYSYAGETEKQMAVLRMWSELAPYDPDSFINLAFMQMYRDNDIDGAMASFRQVVEIDPQQIWVQQHIAALYEVQGETDKAIETLDSVRGRFPDDHSNLTNLAKVLRRAGHLDEAANNFKRANLLEPSYVDPLLGLFEVELRRGAYDEAERRLREAEAVASTPRQEAGVLHGWLRYYSTRGSEDRYLATLPKLDAVEARFRTPLNRIMGSWVSHMEHFALAGRAEDGFDKLRELANQLEPPVDALLQLGHLRLHMTLEDPDAAEQSGEILETFMRQYKREDLEYAISYSKAQIAYLRGELAEATALMEDAKALYASSIQRLEEETDGFNIDTKLASYYLEAGRSDDAEALLIGVLRRFPAYPEANILMAQIRREQSDSTANQYIERAQAALADAIPTHPQKRRLDQLLGG